MWQKWWRFTHWYQRVWWIVSTHPCSAIHDFCLFVLGRPVKQSLISMTVLWTSTTLRLLYPLLHSPSQFLASAQLTNKTKTSYGIHPHYKYLAISHLKMLHQAADGHLWLSHVCLSYNWPDNILRWPLFEQFRYSNDYNSVSEGHDSRGRLRNHGSLASISDQEPESGWSHLRSTASACASSMNSPLSDSTPRQRVEDQA